MVYPADEETFDVRNTPEFIKEGHLNSIQTFLKRIQDFLGYGGRLHDEVGLVNPSGVISPYGGDTAPSGWLLCDGAEYNGVASGFEDLYAVIAKKFGGGAADLFNVPDLRRHFIRGYGTITGGSCVFSQVDVGSDWLPLAGNTLNRTGIPVRLTTTGGLPAPLAINTTYYTIRQGNTFVQFATSRANAFAGTQINITTQGTGTHTVTAYMQDDESTRLKLSEGGSDGADVGSYQEDSFQGHRHYRNHDNASDLSIRLTGGAWDVTPGGQGVVWELETGGPRAGAYGAPRIAIETRGRNVYVNHIIKK